MRFDCDGRWERFSLLNTCHQKCGNGRGHKLSVFAGFPSHSTDALQLLSRIPIPPSRTGNAVLSDQPYLDMSKTTLTPPNSPSSDLQAVFEASLTEYEKKTGTSLLTHPLMDQLRACDSSADILAVLRSQAAKIEQTTSADDKLIKWLDPIVNVLAISSSVISAGVGLVNAIQMLLL